MDELKFLTHFNANVLVICNHATPTHPWGWGGRGIAVEMSVALTKVLLLQCGGNTWGLLYIDKKGGEIKR